MREAKNQFLLTYLNLLVSQGRFQCAALLTLRKSHTHCRIGTLVLKQILWDPVWLRCPSFRHTATETNCGGLSVGEIGCESNLQDPQDVMTCIRDELGKPSIRDWLGTTTRLKVEKLDCTRDWRQHLPSTGIKLEGGLLKDNTGNHVFFSMRRQGLC